MSLQLTGVHTALVTPMRDGELDLPAFEAFCEAQIQAGVSGLVPCGTTGEAATLNADEWAAVVATAVEVAGGRVPVTAGCGTNNTAKTVHLIEQAIELGADAALVVLPYYNKPSPEGHLRNLQAACKPGLPVVAYHVPGRTAQHLPVQQLAELCTSVEGIIACKEATGDVHYGSELLTRAPGINVLSGDDFTFFPLMACGAHGVISVLSNVAPRKTVALANAVAAGDLAKARALHHELMPIVHYLFSSSNPQPVKAFVAAQGHIANRVRLPLIPHTTPPSAELLEIAQ